jgi:hypothetical protein
MYLSATHLKYRTDIGSLIWIGGRYTMSNALNQLFLRKNILKMMGKYTSFITTNLNRKRGGPLELSPW